MSDGQKKTLPKMGFFWVFFKFFLGGGTQRPICGAAGAAVRAVDMPQLTGGVLHTKFWLVDGTHLYVGSANMDWRSLTQVSGGAAANRRRGYPNPKKKKAPEAGIRGGEGDVGRRRRCPAM